MAGVPTLTGFELLVVGVIVFIVGWTSVEIAIGILKWIISHLLLWL